MKIVFKCFLFISLFLLCSSSYAAKRYWRGTGTNKNWNTTTNWSSTSGTGSGASVPGSSDTAYFNGAGGGTGQCSIDATVNVKRFEVTSGYNVDTIKQNAHSITVGSGGMVMSGGVFIGSSSSITISGIFTLSGTNFKSTSGLLSVSGNFTFSSGTFSHNNGEVRFVTNSLTATGSITLYDLNIQNPTLTIASGTTLTTENYLYLNNSVINTGNISAHGSIQQSGNSAAGGGSATVTINGTGDQTFYGQSVSGRSKDGWICNVVINKSNGYLYLKDTIVVKGNWTHTAGNVNITTYGSTLSFPTGSPTIYGTQSLKNISVFTSAGSANTLAVNSGDTLTVTGNISAEDNSPVGFSGTYLLKGDLYIKNTNSSSTLGGGTGTIVINGTGTQTIHGSGNDQYGKLCSIKISKSSGDTLKLLDYIRVSGDWTYSSGIINAGTSTVVFPYPSRNISGKHALYNVTFDGTNASGNTIASTDTLTVSGTLKTIGGNPVTIDNGVIRAKGDITVTNSANTSTLTGGTATILLRDSGNQLITGPSVAGYGRLCNMKINKPSDTLKLKNFVNVGGNWIYQNGRLDGTTYNATLVFAYSTGRTISGKFTLPNISFYAPSTCTNSISDTITVTTLFKELGTGVIILNTGTIKALGNVTISNTGSTTGGGSATIYICGTGPQTLTGSGVTYNGLLCDVKIDKASDTLNLASTISTSQSADWEYIRGIVNPGTSTSVFGGGSDIDGEGTSTTMSFNNFMIYGGTTATLSGNLIAKGNFTIDAARTLVTNSHDLTIGGNWNCLGTFTQGTTKTTFNGTGNQYLLAPAAAQGFYDAVLNKPSGKLYCSIVTIMNITHTLTLTKGVIVDGYASHYVSLTSAATCSGGSDTTYISGLMRKVGNAAFTFPLGDTTLSTNPYHPLSITAPSVSTDTYTARYRDSIQSHGSTTDATISDLSNCEYWNLSRIIGTSNVSVTLGWNTNSYHIISAGNSRVAFWDGSTWKDKGGISPTGTAHVGTIKTSAAQSSFGDFTLALTTDANKYFRSTATGNWEDASTWQMSSDSSTWVTSTATPYYSSNAVNIQSAHTVTINESVKIDQTTVNGVLIYGNTVGSTLTLNNGSGIDLRINGTFADSGPNDIIWSSSSTWVYGSTGVLFRDRSTSSDNWRDHYSGGISTVPSTAFWVIRKTGSDNPLLTSTGGMYYPNLYIENTTGSTWTTSGSSNLTGSSDYPRILGKLDVGGTGTADVVFTINNTNSNMIPVYGKIKTKNGSILQSNGTGLIVKNDITNSGRFSGNIKLLFNGTTKQTISGTEISGIKTFQVNKPSGILSLTTSIGDSLLTLTKGAIEVTGSYELAIVAGGVVSGGSDSSYVYGKVTKAGNTAFTFPLGDTILTTGAYHPLGIAAPTNTTDAYSAKYYASSPLTAYGSSMDDSLGTISNCEYWTLTRSAGTTNNIVATLAWNRNSYDRELYQYYRVASWNSGTSKWIDLKQQYLSGDTTKGTFKSITGVNFTSSTIPLTIGRKLIPLTATYTITDATRSSPTGGSIHITVKGGRPSYTYSWSNGSTTSTASSLSAHTYTVTVTDGASQTMVVPINVGNQPEWVFDTASSVSVDTDGKTLKKSGTNDDWCDGNATTNNRAISTDTAWIEFTVKDTAGIYMLGMSSRADTIYDASSTYRVYIDSTAIYVVEVDLDGYFVKKSIAKCSVGQVVRIELTGQAINYYLDNTLLYTSAQFPEAEYYLEGDIGSHTSKIGTIRTSFGYN